MSQNWNQNILSVSGRKSLCCRCCHSRTENVDWYRLLKNWIQYGNMGPLNWQNTGILFFKHCVKSPHNNSRLLLNLGYVSCTSSNIINRLRSVCVCRRAFPCVRVNLNISHIMCFKVEVYLRTSARSASTWWCHGNTDAPLWPVAAQLHWPLTCPY